MEAVWEYKQILYIAESLDDLNDEVTVAESLFKNLTSSRKTNYLKMLLNKYEISRNAGDQEMSYVYLMRFMQAVTVIQKSSEEDKKWLIAEGSKIVGGNQGVMKYGDVLQTLRASLERRYLVASMQPDPAAGIPGLQEEMRLIKQKAKELRKRKRENVEEILAEIDSFVPSPIVEMTELEKEMRLIQQKAEELHLLNV